MSVVVVLSCPLSLQTDACVDSPLLSRQSSAVQILYRLMSVSNSPLLPFILYRLMSVSNSPLLPFILYRLMSVSNSPVLPVSSTD